MARADKSRRARPDPRVDRMERVVGALSALLTLALLAYLLLQGFRGAGAEPALEVTAAPEASGRLGFTVANHGERAAASVTLALRLPAEGGPPERRSLIIDFVPAHSEVEGAFLLDPAAAAGAELVVESYLDP